MNMMMNLNKVLILGAIVGVIGLIGATVWSGTEASERAVVTANDVDLSVRLADNAWERQRGLSGFTIEDVKAQGMLFVFKDAEVREFWMKGMNLDLDVLWIKDGKIVAVDEGVKAPKPGEEPARMTSKPVPVDMVLEVPAGYAQQFDLNPGTLLKIQLP
jgi:uncharacterized membrane protein (UPF0127 family)